MEGEEEEQQQQLRLQLVEAFRLVASCSEEEALFFLDCHSWDLDAAVSSFFDDHNSSSSPASRSRSPSPFPPPNPSPSPSADPPTNSPMTPNEDDKKVKGKAAAASSSARRKRQETVRIKTLADLGRGSGSDSHDEDEEDDDSPQEYYTGGEKSGMLVQDPSKGGDDVDEIFARARQVGASEGRMEKPHSSSSSRSFTGTGRLLYGDTVPGPQTADIQQPEPMVHTIIFWRNGFTVDDGPLRMLNDPENAPFLESIRISECPKELEPADRRILVHVNLVRRDEDFSAPEKPYVPFQGVGRTLGSASASVPEPASAADTTTTNRSSVPSSGGLKMDPSLPTTSIQLRLSDGTRMVAHFNYQQTVRDICLFIDASRPGGSVPYQLQTGFPPKVLSDPAQTIEEAGLANSVVVQKP